MPIISTNKERLAVALELADADLWTSISESYPEALSGDLSPTRAIALSSAIEAAVIEWLQLNVDSPEPEIKISEIMLHRVEYSYRDYDEMELTSGDEEHIAYCISQGISEGELCTIPFGEDGEVYGYWKINNNPS